MDPGLLIRRLMDEDFPRVEKIILVMDNLNTHNIASLYETFSPDEAKRIEDPWWKCTRIVSAV
jgi:hypothetical protein